MKIQLFQNIIDVLRCKQKISIKFELDILSPENKAKTLIFYAKKYKCINFVETGTYLGNTLATLKNIFKKLYSIELSDDLYTKALERFKDSEHIKLYQGDSTDILPELLKDINEKTLFWLDAHYSMEDTARGTKYTPIVEELDAIYKAKKLNHVILIDDARGFGAVKDYPTIKELKENVRNKWPKAQFEVKSDIIRVIIK